MERRHYPAALIATVVIAVLTVYLHSVVAVPVSHPAAEFVGDLSASRYLEHVKFFASDEMKGRGDGSAELDNAAEYIAEQFRLWGLRPMGDGNSYFQNFQVTIGAEPGPKTQLQLNGT